MKMMSAGSRTKTNSARNEPKSLELSGTMRLATDVFEMRAARVRAMVDHYLRCDSRPPQVESSLYFRLRRA
jgi:hypothetical protein